MLRLIDFVDNLFAIPHDWRIVEWIMKKITPKHIWDYYGNPLCWAYTQGVAHFFYLLYEHFGGNEEDEIQFGA